MRKISLTMLALMIVLGWLLPNASYAEVTSNYQNPLTGGADPTIARAADGYYYSASSGDNNITLKRHETLLGVATAKSKMVWKKPDNFGYVWGPYIYRLDGKWYIYFSSGPENSFGYGHPSSYVLENPSSDPFEGTWTLKGESANADEDGQVTTKQGLLNTQGYGLACGVVTLNGEQYFTYTKYYYFDDPKNPGNLKFDESPTIVKMKNPWTLEGEETTVAMPQYDWEKKNDNINEGAAVVERNGKIYFAYSASSFMNDNYAVGVSVADAASDITKAESWIKHPVPALKRSDENSSYGPGSPLFLKSEDGTEDWILYHGIPTHGQGGGNRGIRAQQIHWDDNDFINLGIPSNPGTVLSRPSGEEKSEVYEAEAARLSGASKVVGNSAYASDGVYVGFGNGSADDYVEFTVNTSAEGTYALDFRYNNGSAAAVNMQLAVNGQAPAPISFASNAGSAANFNLKTVYNIKLNAGSNTIRLSGQSALALDAMIVKKTALYEAEDAQLSGNAQTNTDHQGYSGSGFVGGLWISESAVAFTVNAPHAGSYSVKLRYSLGFNDAKDRTLSMYVNGQKVKPVDFFSLKNWDQWADRYDNVSLKEGSNTITYKYDDGDSGNINLDYIAVTEATTWTYEAESAKTTGSKDAKVVQAKEGNTGIGYVNGLSKANSSVEFAVDVENAASYDVKLRYASENTGKTLALYLNGAYVKQIALPATGGASVWKEQMETLRLQAGRNTIAYRSESDTASVIKIDSIHLNKRTPWKYQAEDAARDGSLNVAKDHLWYEGNGFVGGFEQEGDSIRFEVNVPNTASYTTTLRYSGAQSANITMTMYVNEGKVKQVSLPPTADWDSWMDATESVNLKAGKNIVEFIREDGDTGRFNIDSLTIDKFSGGYTRSTATKIIPEKMVKIQPKHSGKALDVDRVSSDPGAVINQWSNGDGNNQLWRFLDLGTGYYQIQSVQSGHVIDILAGSPIGQIAQNTRAIGNAIPDTQQWSLEPDGDYYKIANKSNGKVITVQDASTKDGAKVMVADDEAKDNQRMKIEIRNLSDSDFRVVTDVSAVPAAMKTGQALTLFGTVSPTNATRKSIVWSVKDAGKTGAALNSNVLTATKTGTVVVTATIEEGSAVGAAYSKNFTINVTRDDAELSPEHADYDLVAPGDVSTAIVWNQAASVTGVVYGGEDGQPVSLSEENYAVADNVLTIKNEFLAARGLVKGSKVEFTVSFDKGRPAVFTVDVIDSTSPISHSITVETEGSGTANADMDSAVKDTEVTLTAMPEAGNVFKEWRAISPADLNIVGNTFTMPNEAVTVRAVFEKIPAATYSVTVNDSYASASGAGNYTEGTVVTIQAGSRSGYTFAGWNSSDGVILSDAGNPATTFIMPAHPVTVTAAWISVTDGSGTPNNTGSPAPAAPSYTAAIRLTNASGNGSKDMSLPVQVNAKTGTAVLDMTSSSGLVPNAGTSVITVPSIPNVGTFTLVIPVSELSTTARQGALTVNTDKGSITIPSNMLTGAAGAKAEISIAQGNNSALSEAAKAAIGERPMISLSVKIDGKAAAWNNPGASVTVAIPYTPSAAELAHTESIVVWYVDGSGQATAVPSGHYDASTGTVTFTATHFSDYAVGFNPLSFADVAANAWYNQAVGFIAARGITTGTGSGSFSPNASLTRGDFMVMLMRAYDIAPDAGLSDNFADAGSKYYTGYLAAAKKLGIAEGVGDNLFAPDRAITRQEMFTLLYNALNTTGKLPQSSSGKTLSSFGDVGQIAPWAKDAMTVLVEAGTIGGHGGQLAPTSTTTRAEMGQVLYNLLT
ncbi:CBM35 domain-containing protein [Cohnella sp. GbtcB17]|uniref:CBM35 domain-containing protein n=1 Tax=Cohnella sp. GbtcB17 TaxID=2824762 RepID=UPI001C3057B5|nr:CBM35 domain-containing protein [Cohnella sp. GbtcB17]